MILNVVHLISNKCWGGGERYALDLCSRLVADGHSVAIITRGKEAVDRPLRDAGFTPGRLPLRGAIDFLSPMVLARVLNRMSAPIVLHVHNFKDAHTALRARRLMADPSKVRVVATRHLVKPAKTDKASVEMYRNLDAIIFVSDIARREFLSSGVSLDASRLHTVHNSIATPQSAEAMPRENTDEIRLAFLGRIAPEKGLGILVEAMGKLKDLPVRLLVGGTGKGNDVMPVVRRSRALGLTERIDWLGHLENVYPLIDSVDIGVMPSVWREPFGLVVLEYMSRGVVPVCTSNGGAAEIISDGKDGILVPPSDPDALADAIRRLVSDTRLRRAMGEAAKATFSSRFAYDRFYNEILAIYEGTDQHKQ